VEGGVVYFAGCMSHLTPSVMRAMKGIMETAGIHYLQIDEERSICCGRPLMIAGKDRQANELIEHNKRLIRSTRAETLVTSCPICYRVFREEYNLTVRIMHHTQFILDLVRTGRIPLQGYFKKVAYHDPCDLGRGSRVYDAPRELLAKIADPVPVQQQAVNSLCCGGSLGIFEASQDQRNLMTTAALDILLENTPDIIATACPLCKKTFGKKSPVEVRDIAELVYDAIPKKTFQVSQTWKVLIS